jgi:hypothetical protein
MKYDQEYIYTLLLRKHLGELSEIEDQLLQKVMHTDRQVRNCWHEQEEAKRYTDNAFLDDLRIEHDWCKIAAILAPKPLHVRLFRFLKRQRAVTAVLLAATTYAAGSLCYARNIFRPDTLARRHTFRAERQVLPIPVITQGVTAAPLQETNMAVLLDIPQPIPAEHPLAAAGKGKRAVFPAKQITGTSAIIASGTTLDVNSYDNKIITTSFVTGSVVTDVGDRLDVTFKPGFEVIYKPGERFRVERVDGNITQGWRDGVLRFHNKPLEDIVPVMKHWFGLDVTFATASMAGMLFSGDLSKDKSVTDFLNELCWELALEYSIYDGMIYFSTQKQ